MNLPRIAYGVVVGGFWVVAVLMAREAWLIRQCRKELAIWMKITGKKISKD